MDTGTPSHVRIWEELRPFFELRDFQLLSGLNQFRRKIPGGFQCVILSLSAYPEGLMMEAQLGLRMDAIEDLVYPLTSGSASFRKHSMTLITPIQNLFVPTQVRVILENQVDERRALHQLESRLDQRGFSFLNQVSSLKALDELYNAQPLSPMPMVHNQIYRCFRGIALASLTHRPDRDHLADLYRIHLLQQGAHEQQMDHYEKLVAFLKHYSAN